MLEVFPPSQENPTTIHLKSRKIKWQNNLNVFGNKIFMKPLGGNFLTFAISKRCYLFFLFKFSDFIQLFCKFSSLDTTGNAKKRTRNEEIHRQNIFGYHPFCQVYFVKSTNEKEIFHTKEQTHQIKIGPLSHLVKKRATPLENSARGWLFANMTQFTTGQQLKTEKNPPPKTWRYQSARSADGRQHRLEKKSSP